MSRPYSRVFLAVFFVVFLGALEVQSDDSSRPKKPWENLEGYVLDRGVGVDTKSLIREIEVRSDPFLTTIAIEILGRRHEMEAKPTLLKLLREDPELIIREAAALALASLGDETGTEALRDFMHAREDLSRKVFLAGRLARLGDFSGYEYVEAASKADDPKKRYVSIAALLRFLPVGEEASSTSARALQQFLALGQDEDLGVRIEFLIQAPVAKYLGVAEKVFKPVLEKLAAEDVNPKVREQASTRLNYWRFLEAEAKRREEKVADQR